MRHLPSGSVSLQHIRYLVATTREHYSGAGGAGVSMEPSEALHDGGDKRGGMTLSGANVKWQLKTTSAGQTRAC